MSALPRVTVFVPGIPQPAGSKRGVPVRRKTGKMGVQILDANRKAKPWQAIVAIIVRSKFRGPPWRGPVSLTLTFTMPRPKSHYAKSHYREPKAWLLKPSAPVFHTTRPDALKLARAVEDALTGVLYVDDAQIVLEALWKEYGSGPGVRIDALELSAVNYPYGPRWPREVT